MSTRLADALIERITTPEDSVVVRALSEGVPFVDTGFVSAVYAGGDPSALTISDALIDELVSANELVLVSPVYNFGVPAAMKAWVDQVTRNGRTWTMGEQGPVGTLETTTAWIVTASGGTAVGGPDDFNTTYLRRILNFLGIEDVRVLAADQLRFKGEAAFTDAMRTLDELTS